MAGSGMAQPDMIFYLWTDSNEICTAYIKLKINHILFMKFFLIFDLVFEKIRFSSFLKGIFLVIFKTSIRIPKIGIRIEVKNHQ